MQPPYHGLWLLLLPATITHPEEAACAAATRLPLTTRHSLLVVLELLQRHHHLLHARPDSRVDGDTLEHECSSLQHAAKGVLPAQLLVQDVGDAALALQVRPRPLHEVALAGRTVPAQGLPAG